MCLNSLLANFFYVESYRSAKGYLSKDPVDQAIFYMQSNLHASLRLKDIAGHVQLSGSHFSRIFTRHIGSSPGTFVKTTRNSRG